MLLILTGKTASGKDTIMKALLSRYTNLRRVTSTTSRTGRFGEQEGFDYNFVSREEFKRKIGSGDFLEYVEYGGNFYGTEKTQIKENQDLIWRIDPSRAAKIRDLISKALVIYINIPDDVVLERLKTRGLAPDEIAKRMADDKKMWLEYKDKYDYIIENVPGKLEETINKIIKIIEGVPTPGVGRRKASFS